MTLEEAIKHLEESLADPGHDWGCEECKGEHEQLLEWLRELKELRGKYREVVMEGEELNADYTEQVALNEQYKNREEQYKRLLKSAIAEWHIICEWGDCGEYCGWFDGGKCTQEWSGKAEALKLIGDEPNGI